jgi:hypothetical protein
MQLLKNLSDRIQEELINVGQKNAALQALHDVITSKVRRRGKQV